MSTADNACLVTETVKEVEVPRAALDVPGHEMGDSCHTPVTEEEGGIPIPAPGLLQVTERRRKYRQPAQRTLWDPALLSAWGVEGRRQHGNGVCIQCQAKLLLPWLLEAQWHHLWDKDPRRLSSLEG